MNVWNVKKRSVCIVCGKKANTSGMKDAFVMKSKPHKVCDKHSCQYAINLIIVELRKINLTAGQFSLLSKLVR